jgi:hypothetical protein
MIDEPRTRWIGRAGGAELGQAVGLGSVVGPLSRAAMALGAMALLLAGSASVGRAQSDTPGGKDYPTAAPFTDVRWEGDVPIVLVREQWVRLVALDGVPAAEIVKTCHERYGDLWEKRFVEDLVEVLAGMGHEPHETVTLAVVREGSSEPETWKDVPMTSENRWAAWKARNARAEAAPPPPVTGTTTWAELEPALRARYAVASQDAGYSLRDDVEWDAAGPARPSDRILRVAAEATRAASRHVALIMNDAGPEAVPKAVKDGLEAGSDALRTKLFSDPRFVRILRRSLADPLATEGLACADCAPAHVVARDVQFVELTPYLVRFVAVGPQDLKDPSGKASFHICSGINGLKTMATPDDALASLALAVMYRLPQMPGGFDVVGEDLELVVKEQGGGAATTPERVNEAWWKRLSTETAFLDGLRPLVNEEAPGFDIACVDCVPTPVATAK